MTDLCSSLFVFCEMLLVSSEGKKKKESGVLEGKGHRKESMTEMKGKPEHQKDGTQDCLCMEHSSYAISIFGSSLQIVL